MFTLRMQKQHRIKSHDQSSQARLRHPHISEQTVLRTNQ